ncbi:MAG: hypothetical protein AB8E15_05070 [Bdellovibrionales bacterium]
MLPTDDSKNIFYRTFSVKLYYISLIALLLIELIIYRLHYQDYFQASFPLGVFQFIAASSIPLGILFRLLVFVRPRIFSKFTLQESFLSIDHGKKHSEIHFMEVAKIKPSILSPRFFGGFYLIMKSGKKFFISSVLKNSHLILENALKTNDSLNEKKNQNLLQFYLFLDASWDRLSNRMRNWKVIVSKYIIVPLLGMALYQFLVQNSSERFLENIHLLELFLGIVFLYILCNLLFYFLEERFRILTDEKEWMCGEKPDLICEICFNVLAISCFFAMIYVATLVGF